MLPSFMVGSVSMSMGVSPVVGAGSVLVVEAGCTPAEGVGLVASAGEGLFPMAVAGSTSVPSSTVGSKSSVDVGSGWLAALFMASSAWILVAFCSLSSNFTSSSSWRCMGNGQ